MRFITYLGAGGEGIAIASSNGYRGLPVASLGADLRQLLARGDGGLREAAGRLADGEVVDLEKARLLLREDNPMPYAVLVSETIRSYLGQRFQAPSTRRTTEEFLRLMEADPATPLAGHRDLLRGFLQSCDLVKFARYQPVLKELEQVQDRAVTFVTATKPASVPVGSNGK